MDGLKEFYGPNAGYVLELYDRYLKDPSSVDAETRAFFDQLSPAELSEILQPVVSAPPPVAPTALLSYPATAVANLAQAIRSYGHLAARLDPLGSPPSGDLSLDPSFYGLTKEDLQKMPGRMVGGPVGERAENALQAIQELREIYTRTTGYDYSHIHNPQEREWLRQAAETRSHRPPKDPFDPLALLEQLTRVETFEQFIHRIFPGKTRFSVEGLDMLVPMLDDLIGCAAESDICSVIIGMAHRGRLNVLAHILGKPYAQVLLEFKDPGHFPTQNEIGWTGDVKYHKGAHRAVSGGEQVKLIIYMPPNPSHLEHVDPVVVGMARAAGSKVDLPGPPQFFTNASLPVLIHGDASFPGEGIVSETLNLSRLPGYWVGGAIHIIANNQLGYTTIPEEGRSTHYASDLAKGFEIPIIHVNADDPQACIEAMRTAFSYRQEFQKDFLVDLVGYRRYGHNEGDEPSFTQPVMYQKIEDHPSVRQIFAEKLVKEGLIQPETPAELVQKDMDRLQDVLANLESPDLESAKEVFEPQLSPPPKGAARAVKTAVPLEKLRELNQALLDVPQDFALHRKLARAMQRRRNVFDDPESPSIEWATAEELAFASILADGVPIRLSGEDVERGTFSQRHAVFFDTATDQTYIPLQNIPQARVSFEVLNSPLSENSAVAFEFGYNIQAPGRLVLWEAQYGDFINAAQAIIDEFLLSARAKWEQTPSLVMLLPHGYEGQGPDHSTGRPERFLELAEQTNLRMANCTTAAQYFHLLRRQAALLETDPLPLIVLTPKSLLRHPLVASPPQDLAKGRWQAVIDDAEARSHPEQIRRLILCSGKIYIDLMTSDRREQKQDIAIVRLEQLYPFPATDLEPVLSGYPELQEVLWVQEEPENMGAWNFVRPLLLELIQGRWPLRYVGRPPSASPAEGSFAWHVANQKAIISQAFQPETAPVKGG